MARNKSKTKQLKEQVEKLKEEKNQVQVESEKQLEVVTEAQKIVDTAKSKTLQLSSKQIDLIKKTVAKGTTDSELQLFLYQCKRTGLDPLAKQIYCIIYRDKDGGHTMSIQTGIDGFRAVAERSGDYAGQDEPVFEYDSNKKPIKAKVTVYRFRGDNRYPSGVGVAHWDEFYPKIKKNQFMWDDKPHVMLAKCAEAQAIRRSYPQDLSGVYAPEEMQKSREVIESGSNDLTTDEIKMVAEMLGKIESADDKDRLQEYEQWVDKNVGKTMPNGFKLSGKIAKHLKEVIKRRKGQL